MSVNRVAFYQIEVRAIPTFKCDRCGKMEKGDRLCFGPMLINYLSAHEVGELLNKFSVRSQVMPVGWAAHGQGTHICEDCSK